jgi:hypothetical protein
MKTKLEFLVLLAFLTNPAIAEQGKSKSLIGKIQNEGIARKWDQSDYCRFSGVDGKKVVEDFGLFISASNDPKKDHNKALMNLDGEDEILDLVSATTPIKGSSKYSRVYSKDGFRVLIEFDPQPVCKGCDGLALKVSINVERKGIKASAKGEGYCAI